MSTHARTDGDPSRLKEKATHGDALFPIQYYSTSLLPTCPEVPLHWHPEMELTLVTGGRAGYAIDFQDYQAAEGDILCIQPNLLHSARIERQGFLQTDSFVFHLNLLGGSSADQCSLRYFNPIMEGSLKLPRFISQNDALYPDIKAHFGLLTACYREKTPGYELETKSLLFHLLRTIIASPGTYRTDFPDRHSERLRLVFQYLHSHYAEPVTAADAAALCHVTVSHFMHYFRQKTGFTFNQYLNQYRLNQSALLLKNGSPVAEAAFACGFNSLPYFYKRFREYYHMTPRDFQKSGN